MNNRKNAANLLALFQIYKRCVNNDQQIITGTNKGIPGMAPELRIITIASVASGPSYNICKRNWSGEERSSPDFAFLRKIQKNTKRTLVRKMRSCYHSDTS